MAELFNAAQYLVDRHIAAGHGAPPAVYAPSGTLTYDELGEEIRRVAGGLRALGVAPEQRVLLCMSIDAATDLRPSTEGDSGQIRKLACQRLVAAPRRATTPREDEGHAVRHR